MKKTSVLTGMFAAAAVAMSLATPVHADAAQRPNPYTPYKVCGSGYQHVKRVTIPTADIYLMVNVRKNTSCVVTMKRTNLGRPTPVAASLHRSVNGRPATGARMGGTEQGLFKYYAGPVYAQATGALRHGGLSRLESCVFWAGSTTGKVYPGNWKHCYKVSRDY